jgi:hypothetical protein
LAAGYQGWVARDTEQRSLRAYLVIESARFAVEDSGQFSLGEKDEGGNRELLVYYNVSNEGVTPAYDISRRVIIEYPFNGKIGKWFDQGTIPYVGKNQTFGPIRSPHYSQAQLDNIAKGKGGLFVFAVQLMYYDTFKRQWPTASCFMWAAAPIKPAFLPCANFGVDRLNYAQ